MEHHSYPRSLTLLIVVVAIVNALAVKFFWYWRVPWLDMPMHFAGGVWLAGTMLWYRFFSGKHPFAPRSAMEVFVWAFAAALSFGFLWEVYEASVELALHKPLYPLLDSLKDIGFDILGGIATAIVLRKRIAFPQ